MDPMRSVHGDKPFFHIHLAQVAIGSPGVGFQTPDDAIRRVPLARCSRFVLGGRANVAEGEGSGADHRDRPGAEADGLGVIETSGSRISHLGNGVCESQGADLAERLLSLFDQLTRVLADAAPEAAAVEHTFVNKDAAGTLKLGQARAVALLVPARAGLPVAEYAPNAVKKAVVGVGHAAKPQVEHMVKLALPGGEARRAGRDRRARDRALPRLDLPRGRQAGGRAGGGRAMIGKISGRLDYVAEDHALIEAAGVGYMIYASSRTLAALPEPGERAALYTELVVREDAMQLFGFPTLAEKEWHRLLTSVQGVGPRHGLAILGTLGPEGVGRAILTGDAGAMRKAPGVGPKIAQRIVLELRDRAPAVMALGRRGAQRPRPPERRARRSKLLRARLRRARPRPPTSRTAPPPRPRRRRMRCRRWSTWATPTIRPPPPWPRPPMPTTPRPRPAP